MWFDRLYSRWLSAVVNQTLVNETGIVRLAYNFLSDGLTIAVSTYHTTYYLLLTTCHLLLTTYYLLPATYYLLTYNRGEYVPPPTRATLPSPPHALPFSPRYTHLLHLPPRLRPVRLLQQTDSSGV